MNDTQVTIWI